jgi:hypothetical protein
MSNSQPPSVTHVCTLTLTLTLTLAFDASCSTPVDKPVKAPPSPETSAQPVAPMRLEWTQPACFAYAADKQGYACLDLAIGSDSTSGDELLPMDFTQWKPLPETAWNGHKAIQLLADEVTTIDIAKKEYDIESPIVHTHTEAEALGLMREQGYRTDTSIEGKPLESGQWVDIQGVSLRFRSRLEAGDASEHYIGSLQLICQGAILSSAVELLPEGRGQEAYAFATPGARHIIISLLEGSGGEGAWYIQSKNLRIGLDKYCKP